LKDDLVQCADEMIEFSKSDFSIGHRGACMQCPEHTIRSFKVASLMGAGIVNSSFVMANVICTQLLMLSLVLK